MLRWLWVCLLGSAGLYAQPAHDARTVLPGTLDSAAGRQESVVLSAGEGSSAAVFPLSETARLPDSPGAEWEAELAQRVRVDAGDASQTGKKAAPPCTAKTPAAQAGGVAGSATGASAVPCLPKRALYRQFLNSTLPLPLTSREKGILAVRDVIDPFNLLTITANAAFTVGIDSHTGYGPGMAGFGRDTGYSLAQDATGEFIGTYLVCSLAHQDPHYHRDPEGTTKHRVLHALRHTIISQHDDGTPMPNYENFITYPASALLANLYVPGVHGDGPSTVARFMSGLATDPVNNLITEFLPDFARHVHVRVVFVQQILNQIATGQQL